MSIFIGAFKWHLKASVTHVAEGLSDEMVQEMLIQFISIERFHSYGRLFLCFWAFCCSWWLWYWMFTVIPLFGCRWLQSELIALDSQRFLFSGLHQLCLCQNFMQYCTNDLSSGHSATDVERLMRFLVNHSTNFSWWGSFGPKLCQWKAWWLLEKY